MISTRFLGSRAAVLVVGPALLWIVAWRAEAQAPTGAAAARVETLESSDGRGVVGRVVGDAALGFRFVPDGSATSFPLERGMLVSFDNPDPSPLAGLPPFHLLLGLDQQISGRLGTVDDRQVQLESGPGGRPLRIDRSGVQAIVQRPGETQVVSDGFEALDAARWSVVGDASVVKTPRLTGAHSLRLAAGGAALTHRLVEPIGSGRLEVAYHDSGAQSLDQRWFVELAFRGPSGTEPIRAMLGWDETSLAVQSPQGPALPVQRLARTPGWHRLVIRFGPERTEMAVDGDELAHGDGPAGVLTEIRIASQSLGKADPPADLAGYVDDLSLARLAEPVGGLEVDPSQDELRLVGGDQLFGQLRAADADRAVLLVDGKDAALEWTEVAGVYFRRTPSQGQPISGLLVRLEWRAAAGSDPRDVDRVEGVLQAVSDAAFTLATPYTGTLTVPRERLRKLQVIGRTTRLIIDPCAHHLGNEVFNREVKLDPPQPEGGTLEVPFALDAVPAGDAWVAVDVIQVAGEADALAFAPQIRKGELRTNVFLNGKQIDYLNRHITSKNETPERIRLPIPANLLRSGRNVLRIEQVGEAKEPKSLDDLGVLTIALEFDTGRAGGPAEKPGP